MIRPCEHSAYSVHFDGSGYTADETEFLLAVLAYQKRFRRRFPTWCEALFIARCLGYRKVAAAVAIEVPMLPLAEVDASETRATHRDVEPSSAC